jgi:hypothetical protein
MLCIKKKKKSLKKKVRVVYMRDCEALVCSVLIRTHASLNVTIQSYYRDFNKPPFYKCKRMYISKSKIHHAFLFALSPIPI